MRPLSQPDRQSLNSALGWLGLGLLADAQTELDRLAPEVRNHAQVLDVQFAILGESNRWDEALAIAETEVKLHPDRPGGWIHRAFASRRRPQGTIEEAYQLLRPAFDLFPDQLVIPYNLACYACQLGDLPMARRWLRRVIDLKGIGHLKSTALEDPDLAPLWAEIASSDLG